MRVKEQLKEVCARSWTRFDLDWNGRWQGPYRVALDDEASCILCDSMVTTILATLLLVGVQVRRHGGRFRHGAPSARLEAERWLCSIGMCMWISRLFMSTSQANCPLPHSRPHDFWHLPSQQVVLVVLFALM